MTASLAFWLSLSVKMAVTASFVIAASFIAQRAGALIGAMVATLPISAGPVYAFLAMDHDAAFIAGSVLGSMNSNLANAGLSLVYVLLAQRFGTVTCLAAALLTWLLIVTGLQGLAWPFLTVLAVTPVVFLILHRIVRPYLAARPPITPGRPWYVIPLRAAAVATLAGTVTTLSARVGPAWSGVLASAPIVLSSLIAILQPRIGGPASAAVIGNGLLGLLGFGFALALVHVTAVPLGSWPALGLGLLVCVAWNLALMASARRHRTTP